MPTTPNRINLVIDDALQQIIDIMRLAYPALKEPELIKMAVSGYFSLKIEEFERFISETATDSDQIKNDQKTRFLQNLSKK